MKTPTQRYTARRRLKRKAVDDIKLGIGCQGVDCQWVGPFAPEMLQFNHIDPDTKLLSVSQLVSNDRNMDIILEEIDKCEVLCANCHATETRRQNDERYG